MEPELAKILDECIDRINDTTSIEVCLAYHPKIRKELEPLLYTSKAISDTARIQPSEEFRKTAKGRLMTRIIEEGIHEKGTGWKSSMFPFLNAFTEAFNSFWRSIDGAKRVTIPAVLTLIMIFISVLGVANAIPATSSMNAGCTLTVLNGTVDVLTPEFKVSQQGIDGMTLDVGTRVITAQDSKALLTFFDGSTLIIESGTDIEIQELEATAEQPVTIVLNQLIGKTWSRVVKMTDIGSHYEIKTPSAVAVVRGTYFSTEVDEQGETEVHTREGLVSVFAHGDEVLVSPGRLTTVTLGAPPSKPAFAMPEDDDQQGQGDVDLLVMNNNGQGNAYAYGLDKDNSGNAYAYGLDKDNSGNAYAYGLDKDNSGNAYANGLDKDNSGNAYAYGLDKGISGNAYAYGLDKDNSGNAYANGLDKDKDKNGKVKGRHNTDVLPDYLQSLNAPEPVNDEPVNDEPANDEPANDEPANDEPANDEPVNGDPVDLPDQVDLPDHVVLPVLPVK